MTRKQFLAAIGVMAGSAALASFIGKGPTSALFAKKGGAASYGNGSYGGRA